MTFDLNNANYDVSIDGVPFVYHNSLNEPNIRQTAEFKREQFDAAPEAGEQTLSRWWLRSGASFHGGAGALYLEPPGGQDETSRIRFHSSKGVDVWTPGKVTRLPDVNSGLSPGATVTNLVGATGGGVDYCLFSHGTALKAYSSATGSATVYTWGGAGTIRALVTDGSSYYAADSTGVYKGPVDGSAPGALVWNTGSASIVLGWVKQRLMAGIANKVYELSGAGPGLPAAIYTHPSTSWVWSAFCEGPTGIMAAGYSGGNSAVVKFELDSQGATPTLTGAGTAINMPAGETILCMTDYLGSFIAIGTNTGLWVGAFDPFYGNATLGNKMLDFGVPVRGVVGRGDFLYVSASQQINGESGLFRVSLGTIIDKAGHMAYAADLTPNTGTVTDATYVTLLPLSQRLMFTTNTGAAALIHRELTTLGTAAAWLKTSRVRFSTVEPKVFKRARVRGNFGSGSLTVYAETPLGGEVTEATLATAGLDPAEVALNVAPDEWVSLRFQFSGYAAAELRSYQLKAAPGGPRNRTMQLVLSCADSEADRNGMRFGHKGWGQERLTALEAAENAADEVTVQRFSDGGAIADQAIIDKVQFVETARPRGSSPSGYVVVTVTTVV